VIAAVVLAAGASTRFGAHKLLAPIGGVPIVRRTVDAVLAATVDEVVVVLGRDADAVARVLSVPHVRCLTNRDYTQGMSASIRVGVDACSPATRAVIIVLADQPTVRPAVIDALIARWHADRALIVAPRYDGVRGNPVLFDAALMDELRALRGDTGARDLIASDPARVHHVEFAEPAPPDIDTPDDLAAIGGGGTSGH
jgi:molybdenum cofactor cytidylyltransferase